MRQLITRIDENLHRRLKRRAASEDRSVNALVTEALRRAVATQDERELVRARMRTLGLRASVPRPRRAPSLDEVARITRGAGTAASEALAAERRSR